MKTNRYTRSNIKRNTYKNTIYVINSTRRQISEKKRMIFKRNEVSPNLKQKTTKSASDDHIAMKNKTTEPEKVTFKSRLSLAKLRAVVGENLGIAGVKHITGQGKSIRKIVWLILLLVMCIWMIITLKVKYRQLLRNFISLSF